MRASRFLRAIPVCKQVVLLVFPGVTTLLDLLKLAPCRAQRSASPAASAPARAMRAGLPGQVVPLFTALRCFSKAGPSPCSPTWRRPASSLGPWFSGAVTPGRPGVETGAGGTLGTTCRSVCRRHGWPEFGCPAARAWWLDGDDDGSPQTPAPAGLPGFLQIPFGGHGKNDDGAENGQAARGRQCCSGASSGTGSFLGWGFGHCSAFHPAPASFGPNLASPPSGVVIERVPGVLMNCGFCWPGALFCSCCSSGGECGLHQVAQVGTDDPAGDHRRAVCLATGCSSRGNACLHSAVLVRRRRDQRVGARRCMPRALWPCSRRCFQGSGDWRAPVRHVPFVGWLVKLRGCAPTAETSRCPAFSGRRRWRAGRCTVSESWSGSAGSRVGRPVAQGQARLPGSR